jgi:hypothetical protein
VSTNEAKMESFYTGKSTPPPHGTGAVPTHKRTPDAPRWRSRLALGVGEGQKLTRCIDDDSNTKYTPQEDGRPNNNAMGGGEE